MLLVERDLGAASSRLYEEIGVLVERSAKAGAQETRLALSRIGMDVLCGAYHDYRSHGPNPKGDLVEALRAVPRHQSVDATIGSMIVGILCGAYTEGEAEARRYVARMAPGPRRAVDRDRSEVDPQPIELASKEWRVFAWLYRYIEVYGRGPLLREMAAGLDMTTIAVVEVLRRVEKKGAVAHVGGRRAWIPLRSP